LMVTAGWGASQPAGILGTRHPHTAALTKPAFMTVVLGSKVTRHETND